MPLQATRNPEHLSMSRDSNSTKQIRPRGDALFASRLQEPLVHWFQPSTGSRQHMRSRIQCPCRSIYCSVAPQASMSMDNTRVLQTPVSAISRSDNPDGVICAPQCKRVSFVPATFSPRKPVQFRHRNARPLIVVSIVFVTVLEMSFGAVLDS